MSAAEIPLVILIGGAAGTGKTSLAKKLCAELNIAHRLGSGFIREIAKVLFLQSKMRIFTIIRLDLTRE